MPRRVTNVLLPRRSCATEGKEWLAAAREATFSDRRPDPGPAPPDQAPRHDERDAHGWPPAGAAGRDAHRRGDRRESRRNIVPSSTKQGPLQNEARRQQTTLEQPSVEQGGLVRRPLRPRSPRRSLDVPRNKLSGSNTQKARVVDFVSSNKQFALEQQGAMEHKILDRHGWFFFLARPVREETFRLSAHLARHAEDCFVPAWPSCTVFFPLPPDGISKWGRWGPWHRRRAPLSDHRGRRRRCLLGSSRYCTGRHLRSGHQGSRRARPCARVECEDA